jgi:hypothetical protein
VAEYFNVVRQWMVVGEWNGAAPFSARVERAADLPQVVIVQGAGHGAILGTARVE